MYEINRWERLSTIKVMVCEQFIFQMPSILHGCVWGAEPGPEDFLHQIFKPHQNWCFITYYLSYYNEMHKDFILWILQSRRQSILQEFQIPALHMHPLHCLKQQQQQTTTTTKHTHTHTQKNQPTNKQKTRKTQRFASTTLSPVDLVLIVSYRELGKLLGTLFTAERRRVQYNDVEWGKEMNGNKS